MKGERERDVFWEVQRARILRDAQLRERTLGQGALTFGSRFELHLIWRRVRSSLDAGDCDTLRRVPLFPSTYNDVACQTSVGAHDEFYSMALSHVKS